MAENEQEPHGPLDHWTIASFGDYSDWYYVEGDKAEQEYGLTSAPTEAGLADVLDLVVHVVDSDGVDHYYTLHGPWDDYAELEAEIHDLYESYGGEAA